MLRKSKNQTKKPCFYRGTNTTKCLVETVAVSSAHLICLSNLGLKVTPGFSLTLRVTTRRMTAVMPQLGGTADAVRSITLHAALREWAPRPRCSASLSLPACGDSSWEVMEVRLERGKKQPLTREVEGSDFWKERGKLTGSISDLKLPKVPPFLGSKGIGLKGTWKSSCRNTPVSSE